MSNMENSYKKGHATAGIILGILGIAAALLLCLLTGVVGGAIAGILGALGLLLGCQARKYGKGTGAIVTGVLALVLAVALTMSCMGLMNTLKSEAEKSGTAPLVVKCSDKPYLGLMGFAMTAAQMDLDSQEMSKQLESLLQETNGGAAATAAPAEQTAPAEGTNP